MFVKIGKERYINLDKVALLGTYSKKISFSLENGYPYDSRNWKLFEIQSDEFDSQEEANKWCEYFITKKNEDKKVESPDKWK